MADAPGIATRAAESRPAQEDSETAMVSPRCFRMSAADAASVLSSVMVVSAGCYVSAPHISGLLVALRRIMSDLHQMQMLQHLRVDDITGLSAIEDGGNLFAVAPCAELQ